MPRLFFEQLGDRALLQVAREAVEKTKLPMQRLDENRQPQQTPGESTKRPKATGAREFVARDMQLEEQQQDHQQRQNNPPGPRRGFSNASTTAAPTSRQATQFRPPSPMRNEPNQEKRRQQLQAAMDARATPKLPEPVAPDQNHLRTVLSSVRPDWNSSELGLVMEKFSAIQVETAQDLFRQLNTLGSRGFNQKLKDNNKRPLKKDTLDALREYGDRSTSEALRGVGTEA